MSVAVFLAEKKERVEAALAERAAAWPEVPEPLAEALRYSLLGGGKRFRPALCLGAADIVAGRDDAALAAACAIEMVHTYSLVHDDLPCMDDDDLRRGRPTSHKVYGEATAILVGDGLLTLAFETIAESKDAGAIAELARAAGIAGMVGGQYLDITSGGRVDSVDALRDMHARKTGALIRASVRIGARLAGADEGRLAALSDFGGHLGLAFQIADDILDIVGSEHTLGKPVGSDAEKRKQTYPALLGLEEARRLGQEAAAAAAAALGDFGEEADVFRDLARFVVERDT